MSRAIGTLLLVTAALAEVALAQPDRTTYRDAYSKWRDWTDPNLERDAAAAGATLGARADKVAAEAANFYSLKKAYLETLRDDAEQKSFAIEAEPTLPEFDGSPASYAASQSTAISAGINAIANDPDRYIQQLRLALERERTALAALTAALHDAQRGQDAVEGASAAVEQSRTKLVQHYHTMGAGLKQTAQQTEQVGMLWAGYYRTLSDGARGVVPQQSAPVTSSSPAGVPSAPAAGGPPALRTRSITALPLSRYVGAWVYPTVGAQYHGTEPQFADLIVYEEDGQAKGTLFARFKLPQGSPLDPTVRFDFEGAFQSTRNQSFVVTTSTGARGTVELIPGPAFNLLEVSFTTQDRPVTVRQGNFLLIKK